MLILEGSTDSITLVSSAASQLEVHASFVDSDVSNPPVIQGSPAWRTNTANITTATTTTIVANPGASKKRNIGLISIFNDHASVANPIEIIHNDGTNNRTLSKTTLLPGELLVLNDLGDWIRYDANLVPYTQQAAGAIRVKNNPSDLANSTTTAASVPAMSIPLEPGSYAFEARIRHNTAATTTGIGFSMNFTGTQTAFMYWVEAVTALTTASDGNQSQNVSAAPGGLLEVEAGRTVSTAGLTPKLSADNTGDSMTIIRGECTITVAGLLELYFKSEVAASAVTVKADSMMWALKGR